MIDTAVRANRLAGETSPYLLQHADNPVDWFPWGAEAFEVARRKNKPIFLSVGYSTCYWCHVMERESFESVVIANVMNEHFVCIKVDREERPDVDQIYMNAVQVITRQGGWPMSVFLTPDLRPFYGGTYFPPADGHGRPGFPRLLASVADAFHNRRDEVNGSAEQITNVISQMARPPAVTAPLTIDADWIKSMIQLTTSDYDREFGGFGSAPKFPRETVLELALVYLQKTEDDPLRRQIMRTLDAMAEGGIRDQLGGGFHRYSTDAKWLVPHFEIMLYDNAMLAWIYTEAYRQSEDRRYAAVARGICDFVLREMTGAAGAFYTAFDAEVDAQEGLSYLWTRDLVEQTLAAAAVAEPDIARFVNIYGLDGVPNFADPHHGTGIADKNILYLARPAGTASPDIDSAIMDPKLAAMREILYKARKGRKQPRLDDKVLTSWNALMIRALAFASDVLQEPKYLAAADRAVNFLLSHHRDADGGLYRTSRGGNTKLPGSLDDYAYFIQALLALRDAGDDERRGEEAKALAMILKRTFGDVPGGGFFFTPADQNDLIVRQKIAADSPLPSGNGVAAMALLELGEREAARGTIEAFAGQLQEIGHGMSAMVQAAMLYVRQHGAFTVLPPAETLADRPLSPAQVAASVVSLRPAWLSPTELRVHADVLAGFHINAHEAGTGLIATQLSIGGDAANDVLGIDYPPGEERSLAFMDQSLRVYTGEVSILVRFSSPQFRENDIELSIYYQACDDNSCLPVVTKLMKVPTP